jgi:ABC-type multidrug transport system fused ATPase/permease subunit
LLVLDEATSSLDGSTELDISEAINSLKGDVTTILIAHRLSTVKNADKVAYMSDGKILAVGSFDQIKREIPDFEKQAAIMGL